MPMDSYWIEMGPAGFSRVYRPDGTPVPGTGDSFEKSSSPVKGDNMSSMTANEAKAKIERLEQKVAELKGEGRRYMRTTPYYADNSGDEANNEAEPVEDGNGHRFMPTKDPYEDR